MPTVLSLPSPTVTTPPTHSFNDGRWDVADGPVSAQKKLHWATLFEWWGYRKSKAVLPWATDTAHPKNCLTCHCVCLLHCTIRLSYQCLPSANFRATYSRATRGCFVDHDGEEQASATTRKVLTPFVKSWKSTVHTVCGHHFVWTNVFQGFRGS